MIPGFAPQTGFGVATDSSALLAADLISIFGATLEFLAIGQDLVPYDPNTIASITARAGNDLISYGSVYHTISSLNGRLAVGPSSSIGDLHCATTNPIKSLWAVAVSPIVPAAQNYAIAHVGTVATRGDQAAMLLASGTSVWYTSGGWTHYTNGTVNENIVTGANVIEAVDAANTTTGLRVGNWSTSPDWPQPIGLVMGLNAIPAATPRSQGVARIGRFF